MIVRRWLSMPVRAVLMIAGFAASALASGGNAIAQIPAAAQSSLSGIRHAMLATGAETFILSAEGKQVWSVPFATRDGWVLPNGDVLLAANRCPDYPNGAAVLVHGADKPGVLFQGTQSEVDTVQPLPGGHVLLTESGPRPRLLEIDRNGKVIVEFPLQCQTDNFHMQTRMARKLANGHYLVPHLIDKVVREYTKEGKVVWQVQTPNWPFTAIRLPNGNTLIDCTHGDMVIEVDRTGKTVWQLSNSDLPEALIHDACGGQRLANGNTVITSYGAGGVDAVKLFEVTPDKKVVWTLKTMREHGVHEFQVLDDNLRPLRGRTLR